jgi:hypothetical protein
MAYVVVLGVGVTQAWQSMLYERICAARSTFLYLYLSVSFYPQSILSLDLLIGLRWSGSTSPPFPLSTDQFGVEASTNRTWLASPGSALGPWLKLFGLHVNLSRSNSTLPAAPGTARPRAPLKPTRHLLHHSLLPPLLFL